MKLDLTGLIQFEKKLLLVYVLHCVVKVANSKVKTLSLIIGRLSFV